MRGEGVHKDHKALRSEESAKSMFGRNMAEGGFPCGSVVKNLPANAGDAGLILGLGRFPGEGNGNPLQHSSLENSTDREVQWATVLGVAESQT